MLTVKNKRQSVAVVQSAPSSNLSPAHVNLHQNSSLTNAQLDLPHSNNEKVENVPSQEELVFSSDVSNKKSDSIYNSPGQQHLPESDVSLHQVDSSSAVTSHDRPHFPQSQSSNGQKPSVPLDSSISEVLSAKSNSIEVRIPSPQIISNGVKQSSSLSQQGKISGTQSDSDKTLSLKVSKADGDNQHSKVSVFNDSSDDTTWPSADICSETPEVSSKDSIVDIKEKYNICKEPLTDQPASKATMDVIKVSALSDDHVNESDANSLKVSKSDLIRNEICEKETVHALDNSVSSTVSNHVSDNSVSSTVSNHVSAEGKDESLSKRLHDSSQLEMKVLQSNEVSTERSKSRCDTNNDDDISASLCYSEDFSAVSSTSGTQNGSKVISKRTISECIGVNAPSKEKISDSHVIRQDDDLCKTEEDITEDLSVEISEVDSVSDVQLELNHISPIDSNTVNVTQNDFEVIDNNYVSQSKLLEEDLLASHNNDIVDDELTGTSLVDERPPLELFHDDLQTALNDKQKSAVNASDDLDRLISIAAAAVESFASKDNRMVHTTTSNLLTDAIDEMLTIRSKKKADGFNVGSSPPKDSIKSSTSDSSDGQVSLSFF